MMQSYRLTLIPQTAFGTPLHGDTLFGQLCWALRHRLGEGELHRLLEDYCNGHPFAVLSNAFPQGFLPRPALPQYLFAQVPEESRKQVKQRRWLPLEAAALPLSEWLRYALPDAEVVRRLGSDGENNSAPQALSQLHPQPHNAINRETNTTGQGAFAPYTTPQTWFQRGLCFDLYLLLDEEQLALEVLLGALGQVGLGGYGRDASSGLGKFILSKECNTVLPDGSPEANCCLTLAPIAPQGLGFDAARCYYEPFTRFGRHGDMAVHRAGGPFKNPLLLAAAGGLFTPLEMPTTPLLGQGLGGEGRLSKTLTETVHQGYAPIIGVHLEDLAHGR